MHAQHQNRARGRIRQDFARRNQPVQLRQRTIHHDHLRTQTLGEPNRFFAVGRFAHDLDAAPAQGQDVGLLGFRGKRLVRVDVSGHFHLPYRLPRAGQPRGDGPRSVRRLATHCSAGRGIVMAS